MDNSRQLNMNDTSVGASMYLSFDSESTMSSAAFKTLEAFNDTSLSSNVEMDTEDVAKDDVEVSHLNSTLEPSLDINDINISNLNTVKKMETMVAPSPLRVLSKNILQGYNALSSTPSKEQLMRSVELKRGSEADNVADLGLAFLKMDDGGHTSSISLQHEENKENTQPESEEGSTLSVSSSVEIVTSVIEQKTCTTVFEEHLQVTSNEKIIDHKIIVEDVDAAAVDVAPKVAFDIPETSGATLEDNNKGTKEKIIDHNIIVENVDVEEGNIKATTLSSRRSIVAPKQVRKSVCEPDLKKNRPSRIMDVRTKRQSLLSEKQQKDIESDIPKLMNKVLKISNKLSVPDGKTTQVKPVMMDKRKSMVSNLKRPSMLPLNHAEKRGFTFTQRMSTVVKTTLNSPARKIPRKSIMPNMQQFRRSIMPPKLTTPSAASIISVASGRKSMLPVVKTSKITTVSVKSTTSTILRETNVKAPETNRKTIQQIDGKATSKTIKKDTVQSAVVSSHPKPEVQFTCSVCSSKFRVKSLLDAHKRSHEDGIPAFVKKPVPNAAPSNSLLNQCKYCDKRFALQRALHIHLLQNCSKIPPGEKRRLQFTEMDHVEKAQLPIFGHAVNKSNISSSSNSNVSSSCRSSMDSLSERKEISKIADKVVAEADKNGAMPPPPLNANKMKKNNAHAGVYRTPSKRISCHTCKQTFKSILEHINHNMAVHSNHSNINNSTNENDSSKEEFSTSRD